MMRSVKCAFSFSLGLTAVIFLLIACTRNNKLNYFPEPSSGATNPKMAAQSAGDFSGIIQINLGSAAPPAGWNGLGGGDATTISLKTAANVETGIQATISERFNGENRAGEKGTDTYFNMPDAVSSTSFFGNAKAESGGVIITQSKIKFTGLNKDREYQFCYFISRANVSDNRETKLITKGANEHISRVNSSNNKTRIVCASNIIPTAAGEVELTITAGENNNNANKFYYLNAMRITQHPN